jgi:hypothetical protein
MTDTWAGPAGIDGRSGALTNGPSQQGALRVRMGPAGPAATAAGLVLLTALATGVLGQGAYFAPGQWAVGLFVAAAVLVALAARPLSRSDLWVPPVPFMFGLAGWALLVATAVGSPSYGLGPALLVIGIVAVVIVCRRVTGANREILVIGIVTTALLVAAAGWLGVAFRISPWGWEAQGVWRASSTLTYPNAMAAVLVPVALLVVGLLTERARSLPLGLAATGLLIGAGATLSRAGLFALAAGAVMLAALLGVRTVVKVAVWPAVGAVVALGALVPSMPASSAASPELATIGLFVGLAIGAGLPLLAPRTAVGVVSGVGLFGALALIAFGPGHFAEAADKVANVRLTLASADRLQGVRAALRAFADHPFTGAGPGLAELQWTGPDGVQGTLRYAHNEYAQLAAELGLVGVVLLAAVMVGLVWCLWQARGACGSSALWAGVVAGTSAFAVHSGLDFIWHMPAIPLLAAALVGLVIPPPTSQSATSTDQPFTDEGSP